MAKNILIVDNNKVMIKLMATFLIHHGHHVKSAEDTFEALDALQTFTPDIIYLDLIMPKIGGAALCRMLRTLPHLSSCYIVIVSATLAEQQLNLEEIGANSAIVKGPFSQMSQYILETIEESGENLFNYEIKGFDKVSARHITQELLSQNKHLEKLLESMSQGVLELEGNRVLYANSAAETILKVAKVNLLGSYLNHILSTDIWEKISPHISLPRNHFQNAEAENTLEIYDKHIVLQCFNFENDKQNLIVLLTDITLRRRMEAVVEATNLNNNLGYIFSGIRHEIGNPVNSIKIALTVLQKNLTTYDLSTITEFVDRSLEEVSRLEYLLKALKNYSLFEKPFVQNVRIDQFMENFLPLIKNDLEKRNINVRTRIEEKTLVALTDSRALHHVLLNLLTNAADAVAKKEQPSITISAVRASPKIIIKVDDNGCGIKDEEKEHLFKPFFTSKPQGTGLGLVIVQKMLFSMNSSIEIHSVADFGTTVTLTLPQGEEPWTLL